MKIRSLRFKSILSPKNVIKSHKGSTIWGGEGKKCKLCDSVLFGPKRMKWHREEM